ncbi:MAG TPA: MarR family transcriptional regulator [Candidatus Limnocylindria bacterium]
MNMSSPHPMRGLLSGSIAYHDAVAASLGINATDLRCLELLAAEPDVTPSRLADLAGLTTGAVTGVLDRLEEAGFLRREADPGDRRRIVVRMVPERMGEIEAAHEPLVGRIGQLDRGDDGTAYIGSLTEALGAETGRLRVQVDGGMLGDAYLAPLADVSRARLVLATGAPRINFSATRFGQQVRMVAETASTRLRLGAAPGRGELIRATFIGPPPDVRNADGTVQMRFRRRMIDTRAREIDARLNASASWTIEVEGGITDLDADLRDVPLDGLAVRGGANHVKLQLPRPSGTVRISIAGGSSVMRISRPAGVPIALDPGGGISHLRVDGKRHGALGDGQRLATDRYASEPNRYELELGGGVSDLRITGG